MAHSTDPERLEQRQELVIARSVAGSQTAELDNVLDAQLPVGVAVVGNQRRHLAKQPLNLGRRADGGGLRVADGVVVRLFVQPALVRPLQSGALCT